MNKPVLTFFADMGLVLVLLIIMVAGLLGTRLPYRQPAINTGSYQLEAFPSGLAWYQYGRVSPFYSLSPLNDYVVASESGRTALLSKTAFEQKQFSSSFGQTKPYQIRETIMAYLGLSTPHYWMIENGVSVSYVSVRNADGSITVTRSITYHSPRWISAQVMTLSYNASDVITKGEGIVAITNPSIAGSLKVIGGLNQTIAVNHSLQLIEIITPVHRMTDTLISSIKIEGLGEGAQ